MVHISRNNCKHIPSILHNYKELTVWQKAVEIATSVYKVTQNFPKHELYGLTSQIRRSTISISSNIAEGAGRKSDKDFSRFLNISYGSSFELETQLIISKELKYLNDSNFDQLNNDLTEIQKMLYSLIKKLTEN